MLALSVAEGWRLVVVGLWVVMLVWWAVRPGEDVASKLPWPYVEPPTTVNLPY